MQGSMYQCLLTDCLTMQKVEAACVLLNWQAGNVRVRTGAHDHNKEEAQDHRAGRELALTALHKQMQ